MRFFLSNACDCKLSIWDESNMGWDFILGSQLVLILAILFTTFQLVKWRNLFTFFGPITFIRHTMLLYAHLFFFGEFLQWNWFSMFPFSVVVFFLILLLGNYDDFSNFWQFFEITQKIWKFAIIFRGRCLFPNFWIGFHLTPNKKIIVIKTRKNKIATSTLLQKSIGAMLEQCWLFSRK